jgi:hypothetical protein
MKPGVAFSVETEVKVEQGTRPRVEKTERVLESAEHRSGIRMYLLPVLDIYIRAECGKLFRNRPRAIVVLSRPPPLTASAPHRQ